MSHINLESYITKYTLSCVIEDITYKTGIHVEDIEYIKRDPEATTHSLWFGSCNYNDCQTVILHQRHNSGPDIFPKSLLHLVLTSWISLYISPCICINCVVIQEWDRSIKLQMTLIVCVHVKLHRWRFSTHTLVITHKLLHATDPKVYRIASHRRNTFQNLNASYFGSVLFPIHRIASPRGNVTDLSHRMVVHVAPFAAPSYLTIQGHEFLNSSIIEICSALIFGFWKVAISRMSSSNSGTLELLTSQRCFNLEILNSWVLDILQIPSMNRFCDVGTNDVVFVDVWNYQISNCSSSHNSVSECLESWVFEIIETFTMIQSVTTSKFMDLWNAKNHRHLLKSLASCELTRASLVKNKHGITEIQ